MNSSTASGASSEDLGGGGGGGWGRVGRPLPCLWKLLPLPLLLGGGGAGGLSWGLAGGGPCGRSGGA